MFGCFIKRVRMKGWKITFQSEKSTMFHTNVLKCRNDLILPQTTPIWVHKYSNENIPVYDISDHSRKYKALKIMNNDEFEPI